MDGLDYHPSVTVFHIPSQNIFIPASAWLPGLNGPQLLL